MPSYPHKSQKTIIYGQAPSGEINISKWVPPFMPVTTGFGYIGVLAEDSKEGTLQCHECGQWYENLPTHYSQKHEMTGNQYREKFGLLNSTALKSKRLRLKQSELTKKMQKDGRMQLGNSNGYGFKLKNKESGNRKGIKKAIESQNAFGVCDLQIANKIVSLSKKLKKVPTLVEIKDEYGGGLISIMHSRYGSYIDYCRKHLKMEPGYSNFNPRSVRSWKNHLLEAGRKSLKEGNPLTLKKLLPRNEQRYLYKYFKSWGDYKDKLLN